MGCSDSVPEMVAIRNARAARRAGLSWAPVDEGDQEAMSAIERGDAPVLETEHLSRAVSGVHLVHDVSVQVRQGEVLAVVGPSGSGKSSFLRLLNRLDEPTAGTVTLGGRDYRMIPPREVRRRVGMVTQTAFLFPGTIADNLRFGPRQR